MSEEKVVDATKETKIETQDNKADIGDLLGSIRQELADEEAKKTAEQEAKLKELEQKSFSKDEVKEMMKAMLKEQAETAKASQATQAEIEAMKEKLDDKSGSQVQTEVEETPFKTTSVNEPEKVELTDEWVLKQKGII